MKTYVHIKMYTQMFSAALGTVGKDWKQNNPNIQHQVNA